MRAAYPALQFRRSFEETAVESEFGVPQGLALAVFFEMLDI